MKNSIWVIAVFPVSLVNYFDFLLINLIITIKNFINKTNNFDRDKIHIKIKNTKYNIHCTEKGTTVKSNINFKSKLNNFCDINHFLSDL